MFATHRVTKFAATALAATGLGLVALASAGTASALGSADDSFLSRLDSAGIGYDSPKVAIANAHTVCTRLDSGESVGSIGAEILKNTDLTTRQAAVFVVSSVSTYCPEHEGQFT
jgi:hypothetical protein